MISSPPWPCSGIAVPGAMRMRNSLPPAALGQRQVIQGKSGGLAFPGKLGKRLPSQANVQAVREPLPGEQEAFGKRCKVAVSSMLRVLLRQSSETGVPSSSPSNSPPSRAARRASSAAGGAPVQMACHDHVECLAERSRRVGSQCCRIQMMINVQLGCSRVLRRWP